MLVQIRPVSPIFLQIDFILNNPMRYVEIISEEIYGKFAKVYHRTHNHDTIQAIRSDGFRSGSGDMYGRGIYATYSLVSQFSPYMVDHYGEFIIKSRVNLDGFLILDEPVAKQVYGKRWKVSQQVQDRFKSDHSNWGEIDREIHQDHITSKLAHRIVSRNLVKGIRGIVYTGTRDGRCVVCYEQDTIIPMSWTKVSMNDIQELRKQKLIGVAEKNLADRLQWTSIVNPQLLKKSLQPNIERELIQHPEIIKKIANPTPEQQAAAVRSNPTVIRWIKNPTVEAQTIATELNPDTIKRIDDPAPAAIIWPLRIKSDSSDLVARLKPETLIAALRLSCTILPAISRANVTKKPTAEQWEAAWQAPDAEEMISMYLSSMPDKKFDAEKIPHTALKKLLHQHPAHLHYFKGADPDIVASAVLSPGNKFGNLALSNCSLDKLQVDCSKVPYEKLKEIVSEQPFLIYAIKDVPIDLVAVAMKKDTHLARDLANNYDLPDELKALVPSNIKIFENSDDDDHSAHMAKTGFWGARGAGCIFFAQDTKKFLIAHRSAYVQSPHTWGTWGGAIDRGETPIQAVTREAHEEAGYHGPIKFVPLLVFQARDDGKVVFQYYNFLAIVDQEFTPELNWETQGYEWVDFGDWPEPLHFGMQQLLSDSRSVQIMKQLLSQ
jgi:8-oxo-dGTP pyrophosphatase MutT (NUDIX family)